MAKEPAKAASEVRCPGCGGRQKPGAGQTIFYCQKCRCQFDADPDEGGDYSDRNASARLERAERERERERERRAKLRRR